MKNKLYHGKIFYGWYIVAAGLIIMSVGWGIVFNTASLFIEPVGNDLGLSRQGINTTLTIRSLCQLIVYFFSGILYSKVKIKSLMKIASITLPISFFLHSYAESQAMLYLLTAISGVSIVLVGTLPISIILNNWFHERKGFVIGLALMGSGIGGMLFNFLTGIWIVNFGWRITYQILAIILFVTLIPCVFLIIKIHPSEVGLTPLGESIDNGLDNSKEKVVIESGVMLSEAVKTTTFWGICLCTTFSPMAGVSLMTSIPPHLSNIGYSTTISANITALSMGSLAVGKLLLGYLFDRFGLRKATFISCLCIVVGCISMIYALNYIALILLVVCVGLGCSFLTVAYPIITQNVFGQKDYNAIFGVLSAAHSLGGMIAPIIIGYIYDIVGSYNPSFMIMTVLGIFATVVFQFVFPKEDKSVTS